MERFGPFEVGVLLGKGGVAEVHLARGPDGVPVALKRLLPGRSGHAAARQAFRDEARLGRLLDHPGIVRVLDEGEEGGVPFLVLEYVPGVTLAALLRHRLARGLGPFPVRAAREVVLQVCAALEHAHRRRDAGGRRIGLVHRDLKPANVLLTPEGRVKVSDFGVAKARINEYETRTGDFRGTPAYLSPEACVGEPMDRRADLFSLATIAAELVLGETVFADEGVYRILQRVVEVDVAGTLERLAAAHPGYALAVAGAWRRSPAERYASAAEMAAAFEDRGGQQGDLRELAAWVREAMAAATASGIRPAAEPPRGAAISAVLPRMVPDLVLEPARGPGVHGVESPVGGAFGGYRDEDEDSEPGSRRGDPGDDSGTDPGLPRGDPGDVADRSGPSPQAAPRGSAGTGALADAPVPVRSGRAWRTGYTVALAAAVALALASWLLDPPAGPRYVELAPSVAPDPEAPAAAGAGRLRGPRMGDAALPRGAPRPGPSATAAGDLGSPTPVADPSLGPAAEPVETSWTAPFRTDSSALRGGESVPDGGPPPESAVTDALGGPLPSHPCFEGAAQPAALPEVVTVHFTIFPNGRVGRVQVRPSSAAGQELQECLGPAFSALRFPTWRGPAAERAYRVRIGS